MAYTTETRTATLLDRVGTYFASLREDWAKARQVERTYNELSALSDAELADIGIHRTDILQISRETVYES